MANFPNQQLTDLGWDAISEGLTGRKLLFDRVMAGQGYLDPAQDPDDLSNMTRLEEYVMDLQIAGMTADGHGRATIYATLMSRDVPVGFFLRELGVTCTVGEAPDPVDPQVLYSICNADDQATYVPAADEASKMVLGVEIHIIVGKATNIDVTITAGTIRAINLGDRIDLGTGNINPSVFAQQTGLVMEFRRLKADGSIKLAERTDYVEIGGGLPLPLPGEPGGPDDGGPVDPDTTLAGLVPVGTVLPYIAAVPPAGYFVCNGQAVSRVAYARLFSLIQGTYGAGDGVNTFNVPNIQGRAPIGSGVAPGNPTNRLLGQAGGVETHVLSDPEMPFHNHSGACPNHYHSLANDSHVHFDSGHGHGGVAAHTHGYVTFLSTIVSPNDGIPGMQGGVGMGGTQTDPAGGGAVGTGFATITASGTNAFAGDVTTNLGFTVDTRGGNQPHTNMQPFIVVNYIIKY